MQELIGPGEIGGEGFFDEHMPTAFECFHAFLRAGAVIAKKANRIELLAGGHLCGIGESGYAEFLADALEQWRLRAGCGDQFHVFVGRHIRQQIPHVIVRQPNEPHANHTGKVWGERGRGSTFSCEIEANR